MRGNTAQSERSGSATGKTAMNETEDNLSPRAESEFAASGGSAATDARELRQTATGVIIYMEDGKEHRWCIGCMAWETPEHLKKHLATWKPQAKFVSGEIIPDKQQNDQAQRPGR